MSKEEKEKYNAEYQKELVSDFVIANNLRSCVCIMVVEDIIILKKTSFF